MIALYPIHIKASRNLAIPTLDKLLGPNGPPPGLILVAGTAIAGKSDFVSQWFNVASHHLYSTIYCHYDYSEALGPKQLISAFGKFDAQYARQVARADQKTDHCAYYFQEVDPPVTFDYLKENFETLCEVLAQRNHTRPGLIIFDTLYQALYPGMASRRAHPIAPGKISLVHEWALKNNVTVVGTVDVHVNANHGASLLSPAQLIHTIGPYFERCNASLVLSLTRPTLMPAPDTERVHVRLVTPASVPALDKAPHIDLTYMRKRRWFNDAETQNNLSLRG